MYLAPVCNAVTENLNNLKKSQTRCQHDWNWSSQKSQFHLVNSIKLKNLKNLKKFNTSTETENFKNLKNLEQKP